MRVATALFATLLLSALIAPPAFGGTLFSFGYTELDGDFVLSGADTGTLSVTASALATGGPFDSHGDVTRTTPPHGTATFDDGFVALPDLGDVEVTMSLTNISSTAAEATGAFVLTDADGDTISGDLSGNWTRTGSFASFEGLIAGVVLTDTSGDGTFDGSSDGSFLMDFDANPPFSGAIIALQTGAWFTTAFTDVDTQFNGIVVPEPASLVLLLGLAFAARR